MIYFFLATALIAVLAISAVMTMANAKKETLELTKKCDDLENMVVSLAQTVAELSEQCEKHDQIIEHLDEHVVQMFNEAYNNAARELSAGIDQVLNFTPYGVK
jgi:cell division protein FtsL